jgi:hypothetical protein
MSGKTAAGGPLSGLQGPHLPGKNILDFVINYLTKNSDSYKVITHTNCCPYNGLNMLKLFNK